MNAAPFQHPFRHFPGIPRVMGAVEEAASAVLLFAEVSGDHGLRNACKVFWNLKKVAVSHVSTLGNVSHVSYAADTTLPTPTIDETLMLPPPGRVINPPVHMAEYKAGVLASTGGCSSSVFIDEIVILESSGIYAATLPAINADKPWYGVNSDVDDNYTFFAANSSPGDTELVMTIPAEFKPIDAGSTTRFWLTAASTVTPAITVSFEFWTYP